MDAGDAESILEAYGLELSLKDGVYLVDDVTEDSDLWLRLVPAVREYQQIRASRLGLKKTVGIGDHIWTEFSERERRAAPFLIIDASVIGFPTQSAAYRPTVFAGGCAQCGSGQKQVSDFELHAKINWKARGFFQMNWIEDELFVRSDVYREVLARFGIKTRPVRRRGQPLEDTLQLAIPDSVDVSIVDVPFSRCLQCDTKNYERVARAYAPSPTSHPGSDLFKSNQRFYSFHRSVYVSQNLYAAIVASGVRGVGFWPCANGGLTTMMPGGEEFD